MCELVSHWPVSQHSLLQNGPPPAFSPPFPPREVRVRPARALDIHVPQPGHCCPPATLAQTVLPLACIPARAPSPGALQTSKHSFEGQTVPLNTPFRDTSMLFWWENFREYGICWGGRKHGLNLYDQCSTRTSKYLKVSCCPPLPCYVPGCPAGAWTAPPRTAWPLLRTLATSAQTTSPLAWIAARVCSRP